MVIDRVICLLGFTGLYDFLIKAHVLALMDYIEKCFIAVKALVSSSLQDTNGEVQSDCTLLPLDSDVFSILFDNDDLISTISLYIYIYGKQIGEYIHDFISIQFILEDLNIHWDTLLLQFILEQNA